MRTSVDACYPQNMADPAHDIYLGYCDGTCAFQPNPLNRPVRYIISSVATNAGVIGDVEPGNPWWDVWVPWVVQRRAAGVDPTLYCCDDGFGSNFWDGWRRADGVAHFRAAGVREPHWWIFNFNKSFVPSYAVANQVSDNITPGWDLSLVLDSGWPGVDPPKENDDMPVLYVRANGTDIWYRDAGAYFQLHNPADANAFTAKGVQQIGPITDEFHNNLLASVLAGKLTGVLTLSLTGSGTVTAS